jgi:E3 ubiquitin-protein ligase RNF5
LRCTVKLNFRFKFHISFKFQFLAFLEPETSGGGQPGFWGIGNGAGGFQMSFGIGAFPFGIFATNFNIGGDGTLGGGQQVPVGSAQYEEEQFLSKVFLWIAVAFIVWLAIA